MLYFLITQFYFVFFMDKVLILADMIYTETKPFMISTEGCKIPSFPLISEKIKGFIKLTQKHTCRKTVLVTSNSSHIWVIRDSFDEYNIYKSNDFYCCYRNFFASNNIANITYGNCKYFSTIINAEHEFVRVTCYYLDDEIYDDFFIFHIKDSSYEINNTTYNILILGIESMSRMNFHRTMPKTSKYLRDHGGIEMLGYNKVGDNSFPNLFPVLTGKSFSYVKENCIKHNNMDTKNCTYIWDEFKKIGYNTILGSDSVSGLLGSYEKRFLKMPTDFYLQPFIDETMNLIRHKNYNFHICYGNHYYYKLLLNYIHGVMHKLKLTRSFGIFWEESVSHEDLNKPNIMDEDYLNLLYRLESDFILDKTILIFLSDHGMRWGPIVRTEQGRQEERLPLLNFLLPDRFRYTYKKAFQNLQDNSYRLTTPYDLHTTLLNLLNLDHLEDSYIDNKMKFKHKNFDKEKSSLFLPISEYRTCESIGIENHWCTCTKGKRSQIGPKTRQQAAQYVVESINKLINIYPQCHSLHLKNILHITLTKERHNRILTVIVKLSPGNGIFHATLHRKKGKWIISGTVSRLNSYRNENNCITDEAVKLYCLCK